VLVCEGERANRALGRETVVGDDGAILFKLQTHKMDVLCMNKCSDCRVSHTTH
jgi:hypothetical protein